MSLFKDVTPNITWGEGAEVSCPLKCCEIVGNTVTTRKRDSTLGELDVVFPPEDPTGGRMDCIEVSKVKSELDSKILEALRTALMSRAILHRQEDGGITGRSSAWDDAPTCIMPRDDGQVPKIKLVLGELTFPVSKA
jgi:hypothetical protein